MKNTLAAAICAATLVAGCNNAGTDTTADQAADTAQATPPAVATPTEPADWNRVALGLREAQLLGADLLGVDEAELGEVRSLLTGPDGRVDRLLVEIDESDPDRFVEVPVAGLTVLTRGSDIDLVSTMTAAEFAALPEGTPPAN